MTGDVTPPDQQVNRIFTTTRVISAVIIPFLLLAFLILYFYPDQSGERFAWAIRPHMTAMFIGAGYLGGAYFFLRVVVEKCWQRVAAGFLPVTAFTSALLLTTVLHWGTFDFTRLPALLWLVLYVITPFLVPWLWWRNRVVDPGTPEPGDVLVPVFIRRLTGAIGVLFLLAMVLFFVMPDVAIGIWPWALSPLTARVVGGWLALFGVGALVVAGDSRWSAWRIEIESIVLWHGLAFTAAMFNLADFKTPFNWYFIATAAGIAGFLAIYVSLEIRRHRQG